MEVDVILLSSGKTKNGKTALTYAYCDSSDKYKKGYTVITQYIDNSSLHENFGIKDFGKLYSAIMCYVDTFNGQARKEISSLFVKETGEVVFEF